MKKKTIAFSVVVLLVVIGGTVWAFRIRSNSQIERIREMQKEMFAEGKPPQPEQFEKFQKEMDKLSPSQREEFGKRSFGDMRRQMEKPIDDYFATPPEERNAFLDRQIKEMDDNMKRWAAAGPPKGQAAPAAAPAAGQTASNSPAPPPRKEWSSEDRSQHRNKMLDFATPAQRAKFTAYFAAMQKRRKELGLPAFPAFPKPPAK